MTTEDEVRALECLSVPPVPHYETKAYAIARDIARLHAARLRVVEAAKEWRIDGRNAIPLIDAVHALVALEKEADRG